jgi:hypothetical protein
MVLFLKCNASMLKEKDNFTALGINGRTVLKNADA